MLKRTNNKVAIIIVNWNGLVFLRDCFESLQKQTYALVDVYFVDNGSSDDSVVYLENNFKNTRIIKLDHNTGFSYANNIGIHEAFKDPEVEYIFTLNNDTVIDKDCIAQLVHLIEQDDGVASVSPMIKFMHDRNLIDSTGLVISSDGGGMNRNHKEEDKGQCGKSGEIFGACAGAALYRKASLMDTVYKGEFFDDSFFAYYEDLDLAWRLRLQGWKSWYCAEALVFHVHSGTGIMYSPMKAYHVNRNRFFLIIKNFPGKYLLRAFWLTPIRYAKLVHSMLFKKSGPSYQLKKKTNSFMPVFLAVKGWGSLLLQLPFLIIKRYNGISRRVVSREEIGRWFKEYGASVNDMIYK